MQIHTAEHEDILAMFERDYRGHGRLDREDKAIWPKGNVYQDGRVNDLFIAFRRGYAAARAVAQMENA